MSKLRKSSQLKKTDKRELILDSASKLFAQRNYHEVMMDDVAKDLSIAKGTLYLYFNSKEELYFSIVENRLSRLIASLNDVVHSSSNSIDALHSLVQHLFMFMCKYQTFFQVYWYQNIKPKNSSCNSIDKLEKKLKVIACEIVDEGKSENLFKEIETEFVVEIILSAIFTGVERLMNKRLTAEMKFAEANKIYDLILGGLFSGFVKKITQPLQNVSVVLTRSVDEQNESAKIMEAFGAKVTSFPTIAFKSSSSIEELEKFILTNTKVDYLILTSVTAAKYFNELIRRLAMESFYEKAKIICIGNKTTAYCESIGLKVVFTPKKFSSTDFLHEMKINVAGKSFLLPHSSLAQSEIDDYLKENKATVYSFELYENTLPDSGLIENNMSALLKENPDWVIFTSPSTFNNFIKILGKKNCSKFFGETKIIAIGPSTSNAIAAANYAVALQPDEYSMEGIAKALIELYNKNR